jgi:hypothetical protein
MEFERGIYRMHERMLQNRTAPKIANIVFKIGVVVSKFLIMASYILIGILSIIKFIHFHKSYVNNGEILSKYLEQ